MFVCYISNFLPMFLSALITFILIWNFSKIKHYLFNNFLKYLLQWSINFLLNSKGENINIATGIKTNISKLVNILIESQSTSVSVQYEGGTPGDIHGIYSDVTKMNKILGSWEKKKINKGIKEMVEFYKG